jgi:SAM-dependent methyltransferase
VLNKRAGHRVDVTDTEAVRAFVEHSDAYGPPGSEAVSAYWRTVSFFLPDWLIARAAQLHPFYNDYFDLQDQLYIFMHGVPYADSTCEFTQIDKEAAVASRLAYPSRTPRELNTYMRAHAKFADQIDSDLACDVLEVGSGWGFSAEYVARLGHRVTAVDINPDFVEVATRRSERSSLGIDYRLGTFENLPLHPNEMFDVAYCFEAFHHARYFCATLSRLVARLRPHGQFIIFGEPFIDESMWQSWGLRLDPLSVYCIAKFGWWESGWTRTFMGGVFRSVGLCSTFVDENSDFERYMVGRRGGSFDADQVSYRPAADGWQRDRHYLVSAGDSRIEFHRPLRRVALDIDNFGTSELSARLESQALPAPVAVTLAPGANRIEVQLGPCPPSGHWELRIVSQTWNPLRALGKGEDRELAFHLRSVEEEPAETDQSRTATEA